MRIAMWSGPRNLSTALMYSFAARGDCAIWDEPYYAAYLSATGLNHPMHEEIVAAGQVDPSKVSARCIGPIPEGQKLFYQKHMAQHMIDRFDRSWLANMTNVFLIRHPARVIASYDAKRQYPSLDDLGYRQQAELFDQVSQIEGRAPAVIDSSDIRCDPEAALRKLCIRIELRFKAGMLRWPRGGHPDDGPWAAHWYKSAWDSDRFSKPEPSLPTVPEHLVEICEQALDFYNRIARYRL